MKFIRNVTKEQWYKIAFLLVTAVLFYFIIPLAKPLLLAVVVAIVMEPIVKSISKRTKMKRKSSVAAIFIIATILLGSIGTFVGIKSTVQVINFVEDVPSYIKSFDRNYKEWTDKVRDLTDEVPTELMNIVTEEVDNGIEGLAEWSKEKLSFENISGILSKVPMFIVNTIFFLIALFFIMIEYDRLNGMLKKLFNKKLYDNVVYVKEKLVGVMYGTIRAQLMLSLIIAGVSFLALLYIAPRYALTLALIIWIIDLLPIIGSAAVLLPWLIYLFIVGDNVLGVKVLILLVVLTVLRRILEPKIISDSIGISPLMALIAMFIGLKIFGFFGLIIGPMLVVLFTALVESEVIKIPKI